MPKKRRDIDARRADDLLAGVDVYRPFPRLLLNEEQWNKIASLSGVPKGDRCARSEIETALGKFRQSQSGDLTATPPFEISEGLKFLADDARRLCEGLSRLLDGLSIEQNTQVNEDRQLSQALVLLRGLPKCFQVAGNRLQHQKPGPKADNMYWLVAQLDAIREQAIGKKIARSTKRTDTSREYIAYVCRIADPAVGDGTLELAMKERIKVRRAGYGKSASPGSVD
jgi:hypothetical protein